MLERFEGEKRKQTIVFILVVAMGVGIMFVVSNILGGKKSQKAEKEVPKVKIVKKETEEVPFKKVYGERLNQLEAEIEDLKKDIKMMTELIKNQPKQPPELNLEGQFKKPDYEEKSEKEGLKIVSSKEEIPPPVYQPVQTQPQKQQKQISVKVLNDLIAMEGSPAEKEVQPEVKQQEEEKKEEKKEEKSVENTIPAGSFVKAVLLSGLDAPTSGSAVRNPHPVLFKLIDKAILPNKWKVNIKDCFIVGTGYGDLSSERAYIRLERLSCTKNNGNIISKTVEGYVSGEDGKNGLKGRVVSKQGQLLARTLVAGFLQGVSQAFNYQQQSLLISPQGAVQTVNPSNALQYAGISGVSEAAKKLADFYMNLVNKTFPVIEILPGRKVDIVFLKDVKLED